MLILAMQSIDAHQKDSATATSKFIQNLGQWENPSLFLLNLRNTQVYFEKNAFQYFFEHPDDVANFYNHHRNPHLLKSQPVRQHAVRMTFLQSLENTEINGVAPHSYHLNFFTGATEDQWRSKVPLYQNIRYENLYAGVNMAVFKYSESAIKYEFYVQPDADPDQIKMAYEGAKNMALKNGMLHIKTSINSWTESKPYAYQLINGQAQQVYCEYQLQNNIVTFKLGPYDNSKVLVIDPELVFSTYSGSSDDNFGHTATYDNSGNLYTAGIVNNPSHFPRGKYPITTGAFQSTWGGGVGSMPCDIAISKYNNDGTALMYATYLGGNSNDYPISLIVDKHNQLVVLGATLSNNFPVSKHGYDTAKNLLFDATVTRFTADGSGIVGSTYFGGSGADGVNTADTLLMNYADDFRGDVLVMNSGDVVIVSSSTSTDLLMTSGAYQPFKNGLQDGIIARFDSTLGTLKHSTFLGQSRHDALYSIDIDDNNNFVVAGGTQSGSFIPGSGMVESHYKGGIAEAFVAKLPSTLSSLTAFRYWGSPGYDQAYFIKLDAQQNALVFGQTYDSIAITPGVYSNNKGTLFVTKFSSDLKNIIFSTQLGNGTERNALPPTAFMVDVCGNIYGSVWGGGSNMSRYRALNPSGFRSSTNALPVTANAFMSNTDGSDFWLFSLSPNANNLNYATFFGEPGGEDHVDGGTSRFDKRGIVYHSVCASCNAGPLGNFPTTTGSFSTQNPSPRCSNATFKLDFRQNNLLAADFSITPRNGCSDSLYVFTNNSYNGQQFYWYLNGVLVDSMHNPPTNYSYSKVITQSGLHTMKLVVKDGLRCNTIDSITKQFSVWPSSTSAFSILKDSCSGLLTFKNLMTSANNEPTPFRWYFGDGYTSTAKDTTYRYTDNGTYTVKLITSEGGACADTAEQTITYDSLHYKLVAAFNSKDTLRCEPTLFQIKNESTNGLTFKWYVNDTLVSTSNIGVDSIAQKGVYRIKLVVEDSTTCIKADSIERTFYVLPDTYPEFSWEIDSCRIGVLFHNQSIMNMGDTASYYWDFGDGKFSTDSSPFHLYADTGTYTISLTVNKGFPCVHTMSKIIVVKSNNDAINAAFSISNNPLCQPDSFTAINNSMNAVKSYWYKNNVLVDSISTHYKDSILQSGTTEIKLVVYNPNACVHYDTASVLINSFNSALAAFEVKKDSCSELVIFKNLSSSNSGVPIAYVWDFGDGNTSTQENPTHNYLADSTYTITLITNPGTPCSDTISHQLQYIKNSHLLMAGIELTDTVICTPAIFTAKKIGINGKQFIWQLNDVTVSTDTIYTDTITTDGVYSLKLIVFDSSSCKQIDTAQKTINVGLFTQSGFEMQRDSCSLHVQFINTSSDKTTPFIWHFGDGDSSVELHPKHIYKETNTYTISLITNPGSICADTITQTFLIDGDTAKEVNIPNVFTPNGDGFNDCYHISGVSEKCDEFYIKIYNRWGTVVYESTAGNHCWNGKAQNGQDLPEGVYYYILMIKKADGYNLNDHGTITLMR